MLLAAICLLSVTLAYANPQLESSVYIFQYNFSFKSNSFLQNLYMMISVRIT